MTPLCPHPFFLETKPKDTYESENEGKKEESINENEDQLEDLLVDSIKNSLIKNIDQIQNTNVSFSQIEKSSQQALTQLDKLSSNLKLAERKSNLSTFDLLEREEQLDRMMTTRMLSVANDVISYPIQIAIEAGKETIEAVCNGNPGLQKNCKKISAFSSEISQKIVDSIPQEVKNSFNEIINSAQQNYEANFHHQKILNEEKLFITPEFTEQYQKDLLPAIGLFLIPPHLKGLRTTKIVISPGALSTPQKTLSKIANIEVKEEVKALAKIRLPESLPQNLDLFASECQSHFFSSEGLLEGHLLYAKKNDDILFLLKRQFGNEEITKLLNGRILLEPKTPLQASKIYTIAL